MNQLELIASPKNTWETSDDWETPDDLAQRIAAMVRADDAFIIEPSAGTGNIAKYLPKGTLCIEQNSCRCSIGAETYSQHQWMLGDFLDTNHTHMWWPSWPDSKSTRTHCIPDLVIGNPPFSLWTEFLVHALEIGSSRVLFIGPCDQFHKPTVWKKLGPWADRIKVIPHPILGRVSYLKDGVPVQGRQVYDSIFEVVRG
jgi:hypothetical protein